MEMTESVKRLHAIGECVFVDLVNENSHENCIRGSAILMRVLQKVGFTKAYPLTVNVTICNDFYMKWRDTNPFPRSQAEIDAFEKTDCIFANVGRESLRYASIEGRWPGHLTVVVPRAAGDRHVLLDLTIVQASRPKIGLNIQPAMFSVSEDFVAGREQAGMRRAGLNFLYEAYPDDLSYEDGGKLAEIDDLERTSSNIVRSLKLHGIIR